jgi:hypothetical protein
VTSEGITVTALRNDPALYCAYIAALWLRARAYKFAGQLIDGCRKKWSDLDFLGLVADALKDGPQFQPTTTRRRLIEAYAAAWTAKAERESTGIVLDFINHTLTLQEWKIQFKEMFPKASLPDGSTFRRAARELHLLYSRQTGRPLGSKDQFQRKRRGFKTRAKKALRR